MELRAVRTVWHGIFLPLTLAAQRILNKSKFFAHQIAN